MPLFVSHRRLKKRKSLPRARTRWALDSGGFTELSMFGRWQTSPSEYIEAVSRYQEEIGGLDWAAPQDWMCEPFMLDHTGLSVREHQERTVLNYLDLRGRGPFIPVLQGWKPDEYLKCATLYEEAGIDLKSEPVVGVGSVCRRQDMAVAREIFASLRPLRLHGFGVKLTGLRSYWHLLASADSMAWSYGARRAPPMSGHSHKNCSNCFAFAARWFERVTTRVQVAAPTLWETAL